MQQQSDYMNWYDSKYEETQLLIDEISDRTSYIIEEEDYDAFIEELANHGINDKQSFEDTFEQEIEGYGERVTAEFSEDLYESMVEELVPNFLVGCIDWQLVWSTALRFDYQTIEFKGNTYFFRNI